MAVMRSLVVRYGDGTAADFAAHIDINQAVGSALRPELERARAQGRLPDSFDLDNFTVEVNGMELDRRVPLNASCATNGWSADEIFLVVRDMRAPRRLLVVCEHDAGIYQKLLDVDPAQSVAAAFGPVRADITKLRVHGRRPRGWRVFRLCHRHRARGLSGRRTVASVGLRTSDIVEMRPSVVSEWLVLRPRSIVVALLMIVAAAYALWVASASELELEIVGGATPALGVLREQGKPSGENMRLTEVAQKRLLRRVRHELQLLNPVYPQQSIQLLPPSRWRPWARWRVKADLSAFDADKRLEVLLYVKNSLGDPAEGVKGTWLINGIALEDSVFDGWLGEKGLFRAIDGVTALKLVPGRYDVSFRREGDNRVLRPESYDMRYLQSGAMEVSRQVSGLAGEIHLWFKEFDILQEVGQ